MINSIKSKIRAFLRSAVNYSPETITQIAIKEIYSTLFLEQGCCGVSNKDYGRPLIVSLTSYGKRMDKLHLVIESIMQQTEKPNRIILWLAEDEKNSDNIPVRVKQFQERGLEIFFCPDFKSYKKIVPTLSICPEADVITFDDDIIYPQDVIEKLVKGHLKYPDTIIACRAHRLTFDQDGSIMPYMQWDWIVKGGTSIRLLPTTGWGTLFPSSCFHEDFMNDALFMKLAPQGDDLWCKFMSVLKGIKVHSLDIQLCDFVELYTEGLWTSNVGQNVNDAQISAILAEYPRIIEIINASE